MCPFCLATAGIVAVGAASTGGLAVLAVKLARKADAQSESDSQVTERRKEDGK